MFIGLGVLVNSLFLILHMLCKRQKAAWMSYNDRCFHPPEILSSHPFVGNFYNKGISFLYEGLKQLGQAIPSEMSLLSFLEYRGVRGEEALPGGRNWMLWNGHGGICSVLLKVPALPSPSPNHGEGQPCNAFGVCFWNLCWDPLSIMEYNSTLLFIIVIHFHREQSDWSIVECAFRRSWGIFHGKTITLQPLFSSCNTPEMNKNQQTLTLRRKRVWPCWKRCR